MIDPAKLPKARADYRYQTALTFFTIRLKSFAKCYRERGDGDSHNSKRFYLNGIRSCAGLMIDLRIAFQDWRVPEPSHAG